MLPEPYKGLAVAEFERMKAAYSDNQDLSLYLEKLWSLNCRTMEDATYYAFVGLYWPGNIEGERKFSFWMKVARAYDYMEPLPKIPTFYQ